MADSKRHTSSGDTPVLLAGLGVGLLPLLSTAFAPHNHQMTGLIYGYLAAGLPFLFICLRWSSLGSERVTLWRILAVAVMVRVLLLFVPPILSEDVWRYIWDGYHIWEGISPYAVAPLASSEDAFALANQLTNVRAEIGHANIPTVYPPTAQLTFALATLFGPSVLAMRCVMIAADLVTITALWHWARHLGRPPQVAALYAFAPLAILESAVGAHIDSVGVAALSAGSLLYVRGAPIKAAMATTWAIGIKWVPALILLHWARSHWRQAAWTALLSCGLFGIFFLTYPPDGSGLSTYAHRWRANDGLFALVYAGFEAIWPNDGQIVPASTTIQTFVHLLVGGEPHAEGVWPDTLAFAWTKATVGCLLAVSLILATLRAHSIQTFWLWAMGSLLLLSPVVHPWYLLWVLPCAILCLTSSKPYWGWAFILWSVLAALSYLPRPVYLLEGTWAVPAWLPWAQYVPVFLVLGGAAFTHCNERSPVSTEAGPEEKFDVAVSPEDG